MITTNEQSKLKCIEDLSLREIDMAYSLSRTGWSCVEIGRRYGISESDAIRLVDDYVELHEWRKANPLAQSPTPESVTRKPRKRRSDAIYATAKERQAAYRARLEESHCADIEQPSPTVDTDTPTPAVEEPSVTVCETPVTEIGPENAETQHLACYGSSEEFCEISESAPLPVTPQSCSESETLRLIEEDA